MTVAIRDLLHRLTRGVLGGISMALILILSGCGGGSDSVGVSLSVDDILAEEHSNFVVEVTLTLLSTHSQDVNVTLETSGTATIGLDFELEASTVTIPSGSRKVSTYLIPIRDWEEEGDEVVEVSIGTLSSNAYSIPPSSATITIADAAFNLTKDQLSADLRVFANVTPQERWVEIQADVFNMGAVTASPTVLTLGIGTDIDNLWDTVVHRRSQSIPSLAPYEGVRINFVTLLTRFNANSSYYGAVVLNRTDEEITSRSRIGYDFLGFTTDSRRQVQMRCQESAERPNSGAVDPLFEKQWHLRNTGQPAFAEQAGVDGADLNMDNVLANGPEGERVNVAVVDTGLELCHPDLEANIRPGESHNFAAGGFQSNSWFGAVTHDPYQFASLGDHGTSVAGIIAAVSNNGIGGRGVAPAATIRGFNYLSHQSQGAAPALGLSEFAPNSAAVDVFNMSYSGGWGPANPSFTSIRTFEHGTSQLRNGRGANYVKAAGNSFNNCLAFQHEMHSELGCRSSNLDSNNNLPYLIVAGGLNASDDRASYASAGSNIWISAPAGEFGASYPATITTDQTGTTRGYDVLVRRGLALESSANEHGNYISTFNGTSAAAPNVAGAVAVLLSVNPDLTWRDVKHILASTARRTNPNKPAVRIAFGGAPFMFRLPWVQNAAGYWFHDWYGFGAVDLDSAVEFARSYSPDSLGTFSTSEWIDETVEESIPDFDGFGSVSSIAISGHANAANIEAVQVRVTLDHEFYSDLAIQLRSPNGTLSTLNSAFNDGLVNQSGYTLNWTLLSNAFYGENPNGLWTLQVVDAAQEDVGTLNDWGIRFFSGQHPQ